MMIEVIFLKYIMKLSDLLITFLGILETLFLISFLRKKLGKNCKE